MGFHSSCVPHPVHFFQVHCPVNSATKKNDLETQHHYQQKHNIHQLCLVGFHLLEVARDGNMSILMSSKVWQMLPWCIWMYLQSKWQFYPFPCDAGCLPAYQSHGATICCKMVGSKVIIVAMNWYWEYQNETLIGKFTASRFQQSPKTRWIVLLLNPMEWKILTSAFRTESRSKDHSTPTLNDLWPDSASHVCNASQEPTHTWRIWASHLIIISDLRFRYGYRKRKYV